MPATLKVIIHGHFYQPPRDNPWTGAIELQESAAPYHDWNERIIAECYRPNGRSRVLDDRGRVLDVVNNYDHLSFNFGPTLIGHLAEADPQTYRRILEADRASLERRGFGNAIAQAYNHMILPLASPRDRWTQIVWGLADFRSHFGRPADGLWLPETAVCDRTLTELARAGMKFVLLAPTQAEAVREPGGAWRDVTGAGAPSARAYRAVTPEGELAVIFYHGELSRAVAFEHLLRNAGTLADRIQAAAQEGDGDSRLVTVCTDGESYGHHEPMGDMCLAYLATRELPRRQIELTNPMAYLRAHPPRWEVRLKRGRDGSGTAWSCAHGVDRWRADCSCSTGGPPSWNQAWRAPLRAAFDKLRARLDPLYEKIGGQLLKDPWRARDDYIEVLLARPVGAAGRFFARHARGKLDDAGRSTVLRLLEMQRHGMLMYTSCGWFFADLGGLEAVQNIRYAVRAAQLGKLVAGEDVDSEMLASLARAHSNQPAVGSGADIVRRWVRPSALSPRKVAAHQAILSLMEPSVPSDRLYHFRIGMQATVRESRAGFEGIGCRCTVQTDRTREGGTFEVAVLSGAGLKLRAFVRNFQPDSAPPDIAGMLASVEESGFEAAVRLWRRRFGTDYGLEDMLQELRLAALRTLLRPVVEEIGNTFDELFRRHELLLHTLVPFGVSLPDALKAPVGYAARRRFNALIERGLESDDLSPAAELAVVTSALGVDFDRSKARRLVGEQLAEQLTGLLAAPRLPAIEEFRGLLESARAMRLGLDEAGLQDDMAAALRPLVTRLLAGKRAGRELARALVELAAFLNLNVTESRGLLGDVP